MRVNDMIPGVLLAVLAAALLTYARTLAPLPGMQFGPGTFPAVIAYGLLAGSAGLIHAGWKQRRAPLARTDRASVKRRDRLIGILYAMSVPAAVLAYMLLTPVVGFPIVAFALVASMIAWLTHRFLMAIVIGLGATAVLWLAFAVALQVPLPAGPF